MNIIKGFAIIEDLKDNTPGAVAQLGELSKWSRTYSREIGEYQTSDIPGYQFVSFKSIDESTGTEVVVGELQAKEIISVVKECVIYATSHIRPYDSLDFQNTILSTFFQRISNFEFGQFIDNGTLALPEWISWKSLGNDNSLIKVWLADIAFRNQYDEYHIEVVPMISQLDHFFYEYGIIKEELDLIDITKFADMIQLAKSDNPETYNRILQFDFINTINPNQSYKVMWGVLIYGQQGDNIDSIKDAIVEYVLKNSTHNKTSWEGIMPTLFKRTEFVILPRYDLLSIPNQSQLSSLYKSMMDPNECITFAKNAISYYTDPYIAQNTTIFPYAYKALTLVAVNGDTNIDEAKEIDVLFPDYVPIPSTSEDFNRMSINTRNWVLFIEKLLIIAERATVYTTVPGDLRKQVRDGNLYISGMYNNINYLVAARSNKAQYPGVE